MKAIIFGAGGQDGYYLSRLLLENKIEVVGVDNSSEGTVKGDVGDFYFVESLLKKHRPDYVFHFAAISSTSHTALIGNHDAISTGTLNILESVKKYCSKCRVFLSGSALQFENNNLPIDEKTPFATKSTYAVERIYSVYLARYFRETFGLKVFVGYFFNHDSPRRTESHISMEITSTIKRIAKGSNEKLEIGDMNVKKEFNFAGDIVNAIWILVNQKSVFEAVIGCGKAYSIKEWIEYCFKKIGKDWKKFVVAKKKFKAEYKILVSKPLIMKSLGWKPKVDFYELADMMMEN